MSQSGPGQREVAYRLFAAEFDDSDLSYSESDEERAPNYVVTPTGARVNRLFAVGVLTEVEDVNPEMVRGRVVDPTGAFVTYAGQYQPDALAFLERAEPPAFLALSGKARTYEPEDGDQVYTSVRPESVSEVDAETRDRWVVTAAERTIERIGIAASAIESDLSGDRLQAALSEAGVDDRLAEGVALAVEHYGTTPAYLESLRKLAIDAVQVVADERDEVGRLELAPDEGGGDASALATLELAGTTDEVPDDEARAMAEPTSGEAETESDVGTPGAETAETGSSDRTEGETAESAGTDGQISSGTATEPESETEKTVTGSDLPSEGEPDAELSPADDVDPANGTGGATDPEVDSESVESEPASPTTEPSPGDGEGTASGGESVDTENKFSSEESDAVEAGSEDFDPGEFELDEEERQAVEEEYGTEFSTAGEVETAGIEPEEPDGSVEEPKEPDGSVEEPEEPGWADEPETADTGSTTETSATESGTTATEGSKEPSEGSDEVDLTDAVMKAMERLDGGDGADQASLVSTVAEEHGVPSDDVEEAIQDALMSGRCYEPADGTLKPI